MSKVMVVADGHFYKDEKNNVYAENTHTYDFFKRYLLAFDYVYVLARVSDEYTDTGKMEIASGENVSFCELPNYYGAIQQIENMRKIIVATRDAISKCDCIILRTPSSTANITWNMCKRSKKPLALEVVVDPDAYFSKGTMVGAIRVIVQKVWTWQLRKMCLTANGVAYVTKEYLQKLYPCKAMTCEDKKYFTSYYSSVCLHEEDFWRARKYNNKS